VHAFVIEPTPEDQPFEALGGSVSTSKQLDAVLRTSYAALDGEGFQVDLKVDDTTRESHIRGLLQQYAYGQTRAPHSAAESVAEALARAIDGRSNPCLLVIAAYGADSNRTVAMWTFPRESAFQFRRQRGADAQLNILQDLFSQDSKLRKGALFSGRSADGKNDFIRGRVMDFQAKSSQREVAAFWLERFLNARFAMKAPHLTRILAQHLKRLSTTVASGDDNLKNQLFAAALSLSVGPKQTTTLRDIVAQHFDAQLHERILAGLPPDALDTPFEVHRETMEKNANIAEFKFANGAEVAIPLNKVEKDVKIEEDRMIISSRVVSKRLKAR
jgi:hypothetical protein